MDEHLLIVMGTLAGFGALAWYVRKSSADAIKAAAVLAAALKETNDRYIAIFMTDHVHRAEFESVRDKQDNVRERLAAIESMMAGRHHDQRENDGG